MSKGKGGAFSSLGSARVLEIFPFPLKKKKKRASSTRDVITNSPQVRESNSLGLCLDSTQWILDSRYWFLVIIISEIPDSLSCIPDSKDQVSGYHKQIFPAFQTKKKNFPRFRNPDSLTEEKAKAKPTQYFYIVLTIANVYQSTNPYLLD